MIQPNDSDTSCMRALTRSLNATLLLDLSFPLNHISISMPLHNKHCSRASLLFCVAMQRQSMCCFHASCSPAGAAHSARLCAGNKAMLALTCYTIEAFTALTHQAMLWQSVQGRST